MNLDDPDDRDVAAGEYVLGTLTGDERVRFEEARMRDPSLDAAVYAWQDRLLGLSRRVQPVEPASRGWLRIESRLARAASDTGEAPPFRVAPANDPFWLRVSTWRVATGLALAASLVLAVLLVVRAPAGADRAERYLAVLQSPTDRATGWLVEATPQDGVRLVPVGDPALPPPGRSLQFWTKPDGAAGPTSLGLVRAGVTAVVPAARMPGIGARQLFEVTLEPEGGSTIGKPTGPVLFVGRTVPLPPMH